MTIIVYIYMILGIVGSSLGVVILLDTYLEKRKEHYFSNSYILMTIWILLTTLQAGFIFGMMHVYHNM